MVFISGEYKGKEYNKELAIECTKYIKEHYLGNDIFVSGIFSFTTSYEDTPIENCLELLSKCDAIIFLSNWTTSDGAKIEMDYAKGKPWIQKYYFDISEKILYRIEDNTLILVKPVDNGVK